MTISTSPSADAHRPLFALDTSALITMMRDAPGGSVVGVQIRQAAVSAVNWTEVVDDCRAHGIDPDKLPTRVQYDYCGAYLALCSADPAKARAIAGRYADHPVDRWRKLFGIVLAQLDEIEGKAVAVVDEDDRDQQQTGT